MVIGEICVTIEIWFWVSLTWNKKALINLTNACSDCTTFLPPNPFFIKKHLTLAKYLHRENWKLTVADLYDLYVDIKCNRVMKIQKPPLTHQVVSPKDQISCVQVSLLLLCIISEYPSQSIPLFSRKKWRVWEKVNKSLLKQQN